MYTRMHKGRRAQSRSRGFSLIELLIVIAIILILVSIAVPMYDKIQLNARETAAIRDIDAINKAQLNSHNGPASKNAITLTELCGNSTVNGATPQGAEISGNISSAEAHGYFFNMASASPPAA